MLLIRLVVPLTDTHDRGEGLFRDISIGIQCIKNVHTSVDLYIYIWLIIFLKYGIIKGY